MTGRVLDVAVYGLVEEADGLARLITALAARMLGDDPGAPAVLAHRAVDLDEAVAGSHHLVVSVDGRQSPWSDVSIASEAEAERLVEDRLVPWVTRWQEGRRAPRAQVAVLTEPDPSWPATASRLIARLWARTGGTAVLRIDHIGSTSVDGLAAKNLIDIQVMVRSDGDAEAVATAATGAGFVHVAGQWHGKDRTGALHPEQVCVDADPGRPVNINIRAADRPVARDAILFRDWLRADPDALARYLALKSDLAGRQVDDYGDSKEPFISAALDEAERWASGAGWSL